VEIHTIGFTKRSARDFFELLNTAGVDVVVDTRLHNTSQLAAFAKRDDLAYFVERLLGAAYIEETLLAPTAELLGAYRNKALAWTDYESMYHALLVERSAARVIDRSRWGERPALLCSEHSPERCHRRIAAEYLAAEWGSLTVLHL
jgi:uncharacterized protein (DUF488 family)